MKKKEVVCGIMTLLFTIACGVFADLGMASTSLALGVCAVLCALAPGLSD